MSENPNTSENTVPAKACEFLRQNCGELTLKNSNYELQLKRELKDNTSCGLVLTTSFCKLDKDCLMFQFPFFPFSSGQLGNSQSSLQRLKLRWSGRPYGSAGLRVNANIATGNLFLQDHHKRVIDRGFELPIGMVYNSLAKTPSDAWRLSLGDKLALTGNRNAPASQVNLTLADGAIVPFQYDTTKQYYTATMVEGDARLTANTDGSWSLWYPDSGVKETFDKNGLQQTQTDAAGRQLLYAYDTQNRLTKITGSSGHIYHFIYSNTSLSVQLEKDGASIDLMTYTFDEVGRLITTTVPLDATSDYTTTYLYDADSTRIKSITQSDGTNISFQYDGQGRLLQIADGQGRDYSFAYTDAKTTITDPLSEPWTFAINDKKALITYTRPTSDEKGEATQFTYFPEDGRLKTQTNPGGGVTTHTYDSLGLLQQVDRPLGRIRINNHDPKTGVRYQHRVTVDANTVLDTYYITNDKRQVVYAVSPRGVVTAYQYDESGNRISSRVYLAAIYPKDKIPAKGPIPITDLTAWCSEQPITNTQLIAYGYDTTGQVTSIKRYTHLDKNGNGVEDEQMGLTTYQKNIYGQVLQEAELQDQILKTTSTTTQTYDGLQRLTAHTDAMQHKTTHQYFDSKSNITTTLPNGRVEVRSFDASGLVSTETQAADKTTRTKTYGRDKAGRVFVVTPFDSKTRYQLHDAQNRLCASVDTNGYVIQKEYDADGNGETLIHYANSVASLDIKKSTLTDIIKAASDPKTDRIVVTQHDIAGRLQYHIDGEGAVIETQYDAADRETAIIHHAALQPVGQRITHPIVLDPQKDRVLRKFYQEDILVGTQRAWAIDPTHSTITQGFTQEYLHNLLGRITEKIIYANASAMADTLDKARPTVSSQDAHDYSYYSLRGQQVGAVDAEYYCTQYLRLTIGMVQTQIRYATTIDPTKISAPFSDLIPTSTSEDAHTIFKYDLLNRETQREQSNAKVTVTAYSIMGYTSKKIYQDGLTPTKGVLAHEYAFHYDAWENLTQEVSPSQNNADANNPTITNLYDAISCLRVATTDPLDNKTLFYYDANRQLLLSINPVGAVVKNTYDGLDKKPSAIRKIAKQLSKAQLQALTGGFLSDTVKQLVVALQDDSKDSVTTYARDRCGRTVTTQDPEAFLHQQAYTAFGQITQGTQQIDTTRHRVISMAYDLRGSKVTVTSDPTGIHTVERYQFDAQKQLVTHTDGMGGQTDYTRDRLGRLLTITDPLQQKTLQTWDAFSRVLTKTDALGNVTSHTYVQATRRETITYPDTSTEIIVRNIFEKITSRTDANGNVTTTQYNLAGNVTGLLKPLNTQTSYDYNAAGWKVTANEPGDLLITYHHTSAGYLSEQTSSAAASQSFTRTWLYNSQGQERQRTDANAQITRTQHDRRGLPTVVVVDPTIGSYKGIALTTQKKYDGLQRRTDITQGDTRIADQYHDKNRYDVLGRKVTTVLDPKSATTDDDALNIIRQQVFNLNSKVIAKIDGNQHKTRYILDANAQLRFQVDPLGYVKEKRYDENMNVVRSIEYVTKIDPTHLTDQSTPKDVAALVQSNSNDCVHYHFYDNRNRKCFTVDSYGVVSEWRYNPVGNKQAHMRYATPIDVTKVADMDLSAIKKAVRPSSQDRTEYFIYDALNRCVYQFDQDGIIVEKQYTEWNDESSHCQYWYPMDVSKVTHFTPKEVQALITVDKDQDRKQYWLYKGRRLAINIDPVGYATTYTYDANGNVTEKHRLANPIPTAHIKGERGNKTTFVYDGANRKVGMADGLGQSEVYILDARGNVTHKTDKNGNVWVTIYDRAGRRQQDQTPVVDMGTVLQSTDGTLSLTNPVQRPQCKVRTYDNEKNILKMVTGGLQGRTRQIGFTYSANNVLTGSTVTDVSVDNPTVQPDPTKPARPEKTETLTTSVVYNHRHQWIVREDEAGQYTFRVYAAEGHLAYEVDANKCVRAHLYNAFDEEVQLIAYATAIDFNPTQYAKTGLSLSDVQPLIKPDSNNDRTVETRYNKQSRKVAVLQSKAFTYLPGEDTASKPTFGTMQPQSQWVFNVFGDVLKESHLVDETHSVWQETFYKYDARGKQIAKIDPLAYLTTDQFDYNGKSVQTMEYAKPLLLGIDYLVSTLSGLLQQQIETPNKDRGTARVYDALGRKTQETLQNVTVQDLSLTPKGRPQFADAKPRDLTFTYQYDGLNHCIVRGYDGHTIRYDYYDAAGQHVAQAQVARTSEDPVTGKSVIYVPLSIYVYNANGNRIATTKYDTCAIATVKTYQIDPKAQHQVSLLLLDNRGLQVVMQDADGGLSYQTFTPTRTQARHYQGVSHWQQNTTDPKQFTTIKKLHQTQFVYDAKGDWTQKLVTQPDKTSIVTIRQLNAFGESVKEGPDGKNWYLYRHYDQNGRVWLTNEKHGIPTITLYDALGQSTALLRNKDQDLLKTAYTDLPKVVTQDFQTLQKTELLRDIKGHMVSQRDPSYLLEPPNTPEPISFSLVVGTGHPEFGGDYSLTWDGLTEGFFNLTITLWPDGFESQKQTLKVKTEDNLCGIDVTNFVADRYCYEIDYYYVDPNTGSVSKKPKYHAKGKVQLDTANSVGSHHLVTITKYINNELLLELTGKTDNLVGIQLIDADKKVLGQFAASKADITNRYTVNLSDQQTGQYTCRPIYSMGKVDAPVALGGTTTSGIKVEAHKMAVTSTVKMHRTEPWTPCYEYLLFQYHVEACPPGVKSSDLTAHLSFIRDLNGFPIPVPNMPTYDNPGQLSYTFHTVSRGWTGGSYCFSINNFVYTEDSTKRRWLVADANTTSWPTWPLSSHQGSQFPNSKNYLYVEPSGTSSSASAVHVLSYGTVVKTLELKPWLDLGIMRADLSNLAYPEAFQYQLIKLSTEQSPGPESLPIQLHTIWSSQEMSIQDICLNKFYAKSAGAFGATTVTWEIPGNYYRDLLQINFAFEASWGNWFRMDVPMGAGNCSYNASEQDWGVEWVSFTKPVTIKLLAGSSTLGDKPEDVITLFSGNLAPQSKFVTSLPPKHTLYLSPVPENIDSVDFYYYDTTLGPVAQWRQLQEAFPTQKGISVDASSLTGKPGIYQYRMKAFDKNKHPIDFSSVTKNIKDGWVYGKTSITEPNAQVYAPDKEEPRTIKTTPTRHQQYDRWDNVVHETDYFSHVTKYERNRFNKVKTKIAPRIFITHEDGSKDTAFIPKTEFATDQYGRSVGRRDANQHTEGRFLDEAGQVIKTVDADAVEEDSLRDGFGDVVVLRDGEKKEIHQSFNEQHQLTERIDAANNKESYTYTEAGQRSSYTNYPNAKPVTERYNQDTLGNEIAVYTPMGFAHLATFDRTRQMQTQTLPGGAQLTWNRGYFGFPTAHQDLGKTHYKYKYNNNGQITSKQGKGGDHGQQYDPTGGKRNVPDQNIEIVYNEAGQTIWRIDNGVPLTDRYYIDEGMRRCKMRFIGPDGKIYQDIQVKWNALQWMIEFKDDRVAGTYEYDGVGNRRVTRAYYLYNGSKQPLTEDDWFTYTDADRILMDRAARNADNQLVLVKGHSTKVTYDNIGRRATETYIDKKTDKQYTNTLSYYRNDLLHQSKRSDGRVTTRVYDGTGRRTYYSDTGGKSDSIYYNDDGLISEAVSGNQTTVYTYDPKTGLATAQRTTAPAGVGHTLVFQLTIKYVGFDAWQISTNSGNSWYEPGGAPSPRTALYVTYTANGFIASTEGNDQKGFRRFVTNDRGEIVLKATGKTTHEHQDREYFAYTPNGQQIGSYGDYLESLEDHDQNLIVPFNPNLNFSNTAISVINPAYPHPYTVYPYNGMEMHSMQPAFSWPIVFPWQGLLPISPLPILFPVPSLPMHFYGDSSYANNFTSTPQADQKKPTYANFDRLFHRVSKGYPAPAPAEMFVTGQESYRELAANYYGDPSLADVIAAGNGYHEGELTRPNMPVRIPNNAFSIDEHNKYDQWAVYNSNGIIGSLQPTFPLPPLPPPPSHRHHSFFGMILEFLVGALVSIVVPELIAPLMQTITATGFIGALETGLEDAVEYAIASAAANLAQQVVAVAFHMQRKIHMGEVLTQGERGAENGMLNGLFGGLKPNQLSRTTEFTKSMEQTIKVAVAQELIATATGQHKHFDWRTVAEASLIQAVNVGVNKIAKPTNIEIEIAEQALKLTASAVIQHTLYGTPIDPEQIAAAAIGTGIGRYYGDKIANNLKAKALKRRMQQQTKPWQQPAREALSHYPSVNQQGFGPTNPTQLLQAAANDPDFDIRKRFTKTYTSEFDWNNPNEVSAYETALKKGLTETEALEAAPIIAANRAQSQEKATISTAHPVSRSENNPHQPRSTQFFMNTARSALARVSQRMKADIQQAEKVSGADVVLSATTSTMESARHSFAPFFEQEAQGVGHLLQEAHQSLTTFEVTMRLRWQVGKQALKPWLKMHEAWIAGLAKKAQRYARIGKGLKILGKSVTPIAVAIGAAEGSYAVYKAKPHDRERVLFEEVGEQGGEIVGGIAGGAAGGFVGGLVTLGDPVGAFAGGVAGGVAGSSKLKTYGKRIGDIAYAHRNELSTALEASAYILFPIKTMVKSEEELLEDIYEHSYTSSSV